MKIVFLLSLFLFLSVINLSSARAAELVTFYFDPPDLTLDGEKEIKLMLDMKGQEVALVNVSMFFDPSVVRLTSDIDLNTSTLVADPEVNNTTASSANSTGSISFMLRQDPISGTAPSNAFEVASFNFELVNADFSGETGITIEDEATQVIGTEGEIPFEVNYASVAAAGGEIGGRSMEGQGKARGDCDEGSIDTAIGCIPVSDTDELVGFLLTWGIGIAGGIAFVLMIYSGYMIITGSGNPERIQAGKELMTAAVMGLAFIVLSVFLLRVIGVDILGIPGL